MIDLVVNLLKSTRFHYASEDELQRGIAEVLDQATIKYDREYRLSKRDRLDFLLDGGVAIEVKIKASASALLRQLMRYVEHDSIKAIVVVTTPRFYCQLPPKINGKAIRSVNLMGGIL